MKSSRKGLHFLISLLVILAMFGAGYGVFAQQKTLPENPTLELANSSHMLLLEAPSLEVSSDLIREDYKDSKVSELTPASLNVSQATNAAPTKKSTVETATQESDETTYKDEGENLTPTPSSDTTKKDGSPLAKQAYFTTTIKNGQTVKERNLYFSIAHHVPEFEVIAEEVSVNGNLQTWNGQSVFLDREINNLEVLVTYLDVTGEFVRVTQTYVVYVGGSTIELLTNLYSQSVSSSDFSFTASARAGEEPVDVTVTQNGIPLTGEEAEFYTTLATGENIFLLSASHRGNTLHEEYRVTYQPFDTLQLDTDLISQEFTNETTDFSFYARLVNSSPNAQLLITLNGKKLPTSADGAYDIQLVSGKVNELQLTATDTGGRQLSQSYQIKHKFPTGSAGAPTFRVFLENKELHNGSSVSGQNINIGIAARAGDDTPLYASDITFLVNGVSYQAGNRDSEEREIYQVFELYEGENEFYFYIQDAHGKSAEATWTIHSKPEAGQAYVRVTADVIGVRNILNTKVAFDLGDTVADVVAFALEENDILGPPLSSAYYLDYIEKGGLTENWSISEEIRDLLDEMGIFLTEGPDMEDRLGEGDFTPHSGWQYRVNGGAYASFGMSETPILPDDSIEIHFTLARGADL